jgi:uncharacterized protein YqhQ
MWTHLQMLPVLENGEETLIGGQAVMEGVMMRAPHSYCIAVRKPDGSIVYETKELAKVSEKYPIFKLPLLRGLGTLGQAMSLGIKALQFSANIAIEEEAKATAVVTTLTMNSLAPGIAAAPAPAGGKAKPFSNTMMTVQLVLSLAFFIFAYKFVPLWLATQAANVWPSLSGRIPFNLVDGVIRIAIFLTFLYLMSRMKDIRRVFEYHGAEHKVVFNFESGRAVNIPNAQSFPTWHPRCGTSFLITVMLISMVIYTVIPVDGFAAKFASRILLLPVIAGLSYEIIRFAARQRGALMTILTSPGLWLQRITTQPPDDSQAEIAIKALEGAMDLEKRQGGQMVVA